SGPYRHLRAAGHHRADARHDPREPVDQRHQGRGAEERHDLPPGGRPPAGDPGQDVDRRAVARREVGIRSERIEPLSQPRTAYMGIVIDLVLCLLIAGLTYALASEGLWGAALMFFNVLFGTIIALNFYESLARLLDSTGINWGFSDTLCLLALFII